MSEPTDRPTAAEADAAQQELVPPPVSTVEVHDAQAVPVQEKAERPAVELQVNGDEPHVTVEEEQPLYSPQGPIPSFEYVQTFVSQKYGYPLEQINGQRHCGPDPKWDGEPPSHGTEIFVGKIPRDCFEDKLMPVFMDAGHVYEMRLLMDYNGMNRGYAYVVYPTKADAETAIAKLDNYPILPGRFLGVCASVDNCRLFVGCIPKKATTEDVYTEMSRLTDGVKSVILYANVHDKTKNRGFAFVQYDSHRAAAIARRKMQRNKHTMWSNNNPLHVDWAEPEISVPEDIMSKVGLL